MRKFGKLLFAFVAILLISGCGKTESVSNLLSDASKKMKGLDNYEMKMNIDMSLEYEGNTLTMNIDATSMIDEKNKKSITDTSATIFGITSTAKTYQDLSGNSVISYTSSDNETWSKEVEEKEAEAMFDLFSEEREFTEETPTIGDKAYKVILTTEEISELTASADVDDDDITIEKVDLIIEVKDGYIKKMTFTMPITENNMEMTANFVITFDKYNEVDNVTIPQDVINKAQVSID